ncbi:FRG domain-containing protein [Arthrobacter citreus]|nr:FRG domain-containing protein [Arthrobacter citreus]
MNIEDYFIKEVYFENVKELFQELSPFGKYGSLLRGHVFRGESSNSYQLIPSALREDKKIKLNALSNYTLTEEQFDIEFFQQQSELHLLKKFYTLADERGIPTPDIPFMRNDVLNKFPSFLNGKISSKWIPDELLELATLAQHYGVPTRLIDWSLSHMTSLYFAASGALTKSEENKNEYMVLWALNYEHIEYLKDTTIRIPLRLIKPTYSRNPNILAQKGVLSCWEYENMLTRLNYFQMPEVINTRINRAPLDQLLENYVLQNNINMVDSNSNYIVLLYKFYIPIKDAHTLYHALIKLNYGADCIYAGLNGVYRRMDDDSKFDIEKIDSSQIPFI